MSAVVGWISKVSRAAVAWVGAHPVVATVLIVIGGVVFVVAAARAVQALKAGRLANALTEAGIAGLGWALMTFGWSGLTFSVVEYVVAASLPAVDRTIAGLSALLTGPAPSVSAWEALWIHLHLLIP